MPSYRQQHVHQKHICDAPQHQAPSSPYQTQQTSCHYEEYPNPHPELPVNNKKLFNLITIKTKSHQLALQYDRLP